MNKAIYNELSLWIDFQVMDKCLRSRAKNTMTSRFVCKWKFVLVATADKYVLLEPVWHSVAFRTKAGTMWIPTLAQPAALRSAC